MDLISSTPHLLPQPEMEEAALLIHEYESMMMNPFESPQPVLIDSPQDPRPAKLRKMDSSSAPSSSFLGCNYNQSGTKLISFGSSPPQQSHDSGCTRVVKPKQEQVFDHVDYLQVSEASKSAIKRTGFVSSIDHVEAERKRREKLTERFVHLSSLLPGLKKLDKASVLAEAAKYVKQLQDQVKTLQEQAPKSTEQHSRTTTSSSKLSTEDFPVKDVNSSSSSNDDSFHDSSAGQPLEIEVRFSEKDVLIRVYCERRQEVAHKVLEEIKPHLDIISVNATPFGKNAIDITVIAQVNDEFSMTPQELGRLLRLSFQALSVCD